MSYHLHGCRLILTLWLYNIFWIVGEHFIIQIHSESFRLLNVRQDKKNQAQPTKPSDGSIENIKNIKSLLSLIPISRYIIWHKVSVYATANIGNALIFRYKRFPYWFRRKVQLNSKWLCSMFMCCLVFALGLNFE